MIIAGKLLDSGPAQGNVVNNLQIQVVNDKVQGKIASQLRPKNEFKREILLSYFSF